MTALAAVRNGHTLNQLQLAAIDPNGT
jgi:hypothetical protein